MTYRPVSSYARVALIAPLLLALSSHASFAHTTVGVSGGLMSGFLHPLTGLDHMVAMVAVGLWGAQLGAPAVWLLPITFPIVMAIGGAMGVLHVPFAYEEIGIALSALVLGGVIAFRWRLPLAFAAVIVGAFAIFHGYAHGLELPNAANPLAYGIGFVIATGLLHLCGILLGLVLRWPLGEKMVRGAGACIACVGVYFLAASLGFVS